MIRIILIALCLAITAGFGMLATMPWINAIAYVPQPAAVKTSSKEPVSLNFTATRSTDFTAVTQRPLFAAVRRPPPPEAPGLPIEDPDADLLFGAYEITGVVMLGDSAIAMLRDKNGQLIRIRAGDEIVTDEGAAVLTKITLNTLTFERGSDTVAASVKREGAQE